MDIKKPEEVIVIDDEKQAKSLSLKKKKQTPAAAASAANAPRGPQPPPATTNRPRLVPLAPQPTAAAAATRPLQRPVPPPKVEEYYTNPANMDCVYNANTKEVVACQDAVVTNFQLPDPTDLLNMSDKDIVEQAWSLASYMGL